MSYPSIIDEVVDEIEEGKKTFTESEEAYVEFRKVVGPGMIDAGFDIIPSKSSDLIQRSSGEKFTDQTLRGHILNGAAFGIQFNDALQEINPRSSLSREDLLKALALFACHDFHKTDEPQKRRLRRERGLGDEDKDLREKEVRELTESLNLDELDTRLRFKDYYASALCAEKMSGRHRQVSSREFDRLKDWVRLMDAAAGMQTPSEARSLEGRAREISNNVKLPYHMVDDTRGVSTNILNQAISEHLTDEEGVENIVHFHNGVLYLSNKELVDKEEHITDDELERILHRFIQTIENSKDKFEIPAKKSGRRPKGFLEIESISYFLSGIEGSFEVVRKEIERMAGQDDWTTYSVYNDALIAALSWNLIDEVPLSHNKTQALGIYAGTVFMELFKPLNGDDTRDSVADLCDALELYSVKEELLAEYDSDEPPFSLEDLSELDMERLSDSTGMDAEEISDKASSVNLHDGGNKSFAQVAVMAFLDGTTSDGVPRRELPIGVLLVEMEDMFLSSYDDWNERWDENRGDEWNVEWDNERKTEKFELELQGVLPEASEHYIRSNVEVDGYWFAQAESKDKHNEYTKKSQGHICLLCNDLLIGDTSLESFKSGEDTVGKGGTVKLNPPATRPVVDRSALDDCVTRCSRRYRQSAKRRALADCRSKSRGIG